MQKPGILIAAALLAIPLLFLLFRYQAPDRSGAANNAPGASVEGRQVKSSPGRQLSLTTEYQALLLSNGLAYYGKVRELNDQFLEMDDVYYVQTGVEAKTKKQTSILQKRGKEWHAPDHMSINLDHVVFIEPVNPDSDVAKLITQSKAQESRK